MPEIIIENSSSEKDIIGLSGEVYKPSAEMIYESKGKKSQSKSRSRTKDPNFEFSD
jgi:hypothetical protein